MNKFSSPFMAKSPLHDNHDEPQVKREELDAKGKEIWDNLRIENDSLLNAINPKTKKLWTQEEINAMRLKRHKEKK